MPKDNQDNDIQENGHPLINIYNQKSKMFKFYFVFCQIRFADTQKKMLAR